MRNSMATHSPGGLQKGLSLFVTFLTPVVVVLTVVRALFTPLFLQFQYSMPGFPEDRFGFTKEERLHWSRNAMEYLLNDAGIEFLGDQRFEDGTPLYNQRELKHMVDVKLALQAAFRVWLGSLAALALLGIIAWLTGWWVDFRSGLRRGGWLTVLLMAGILMFVVVGFGVFFVAFHNVFFQPGTWTFLYSDTLIRLFPERFWQQIFLVVGGGSILIGLLLAGALRGRRLASPTGHTVPPRKSAPN